MPSINMIATRREEKRRFQQFTHKLVYAIIAEIGIVILVLSFMVVKLVTVKGQISDLDSQISGLQPKVSQIQNLEAETAAIKPEVGTLNTARNNTLYWYTAMQTVVASLPDKSWLTSLTTTGDPTPPAAVPANSSAPKPAVGPSAGLSFAGVAASPDQVGLAMLKMNQFHNIDSVTLSYINSTAGPSAPPGSGMSFSMTVALKPNTTGDIFYPGVNGSALAVVPAPVTATNVPAPVRQAQAVPILAIGDHSNVQKS